MIDWHSIEVHTTHARTRLLEEAAHQRLLRQAQPAAGTAGRAPAAREADLHVPPVVPMENPLTAELRYAVYLAGRLLVRLGQGLVTLSRTGASEAV